MDLGPHTSFIVIAYAVVIAVVAALIGWIAADHRRQQAELRRLESEVL